MHGDDRSCPRYAEGLNKRERSDNMSCENCKHYDENERSGSKGYCTWYRSYVYPDDNSCSHYEARSGSGGCIFTSACCSFLGLSDDCYELKTLRRYRDNYLAKQKNGKKLIEEYYTIAPPIVEKIDKSADKDIEYDFIFSVIQRCVSLIENSKNEEALEEYKKMVLTLKEKYN